MARLLVIDDERSLREFLEILLVKEGHDVETAPDGETGVEKLTEGDYDLVITDLKMKEMSGMDVLKAVKARDPSIQVVVITAFGTTATAVEAMKEGAADYITKPFKVDELKIQLEKALEIRALQKENLYLKEQLEGQMGVGELVGSSDAMTRIYDLILRLARSRTTVLISGESGTGKELVARAIHNKSADTKAPFVAVNCGAIPPTLIESELFGHVRGAFTGATSDRPGVFEASGQGSLFLDEVSELPLEMQVKLLRVLQERVVKRVGSTRERPLHCRVMAASNRELDQLVKAGNFREDLYYRLNVVQVTVPPLRDRAGDVPLLAEHFLRKYESDIGHPIRGITSAAMERLLNYRYDGNVRELENIIQRAIALAPGDMIDVESLPPALQGDSMLSGSYPAVMSDSGVDLDGTMERIERNLLVQAVERARGVRKEAARLLGISFRSLRYRLDKHKIDADKFGD